MTVLPRAADLIRRGADLPREQYRRELRRLADQHETARSPSAPVPTAAS
jgi:hypothetical protein